MRGFHGDLLLCPLNAAEMDHFTKVETQSNRELPLKTSICDGILAMRGFNGDLHLGSRRIIFFAHLLFHQN